MYVPIHTELEAFLCDICTPKMSLLISANLKKLLPSKLYEKVSSVPLGI